VWAEVGAAAADNDAANRATTTAARFARPLVDLEFLQKSSHPSFGIAIISETGALKSHGAVEDSPHGPVQAACGGQGDSSGKV